MSENVSEFQWTKAKNDAATLLADDSLSDTEIAAKIAVTPRTLYRWKEHPDFMAKVREHAAALEAATLRFAIAKKRNRVARQNADWLRLQQIREERAADPSMQDVPGGRTGLVVRQLKTIGGGFNAQIVEEFVTDGPLVKAQSDLEKQAAGEVGQDPAVKMRHGGDESAPPIQSEVKLTAKVVTYDEFSNRFASLILGDGAGSMGEDEGTPSDELGVHPA